MAVLRPAIENGLKLSIGVPIKNTDRSVGAMISGEITRLYGLAGLPDDTITVDFTGSAGQSFGSFLCKGMTFKLIGDANDYMGKSLSGGRIIVTPSRRRNSMPRRTSLPAIRWDTERHPERCS